MWCSEEKLTGEIGEKSIRDLTILENPSSREGRKKREKNTRKHMKEMSGGPGERPQNKTNSGREKKCKRRSGSGEKRFREDRKEKIAGVDGGHQQLPREGRRGSQQGMRVGASHSGIPGDLGEY